MTVAELTSKAGKVGGRVRAAQMSPEERKHFAASGGKVGGIARAKSLTAKQRSLIAKKAAAARWAKKSDGGKS